MADNNEAGGAPPVARWMSPGAQCILSSVPVADVAAQMASKRHSCVVVIDDGRPVGLVSERDLVRELAAGKTGATAGDIMSAPLISIEEDRGIDTASQLMSERQIRRLVVVDDEGGVSGVVTQTDMMRAHIDQIERYQRSLEAQVAERTAELEATVEQLEALSRTDPLTGIGNRRAMEEAMAIAHQRSSRYKRTYSVILLDVDRFKAYNDTYGHPRGDRALRDIAGEVTGSIRVIDKAFRYGGEEILVLLPETGADGALAVAERIRRSVASRAIEHRSASQGVLTISAGIATSVPRPDGSIPGVLELLGAADDSLYQAKENGRNRIGPVGNPD